MKLRGKRILVTGANGALGMAVQAIAAAEGAELIAVDLAFDQPAGRPSILSLPVDLRNAAAVMECFASAGEFDVLFNLAGGFAMGTPAYAAESSQWDEMFRINVDTMRNAVAAAVPMMLRNGHGSIVNVGAMSAREGLAQMSAYGAAKSTVMRLTESLSRELRDHGINVNAVLPSILDTPRNRQDMPDADFARWVRTDELARVICFLGSDDARAIHGALIPVTGLS